MPQLEDIVASVPPITRCYLLSAIALMCLCSLDILSPFHLYLNWSLVFKKFQVWRLVSCFLFFGDFSLHFFWNLYILLCYSGSLEKGCFRNRPADFLWFFITTGSIVLVLSYIFNSGIFFSAALLNILTYIWSRKNPHVRMRVFFFSMNAPYLPWMFCGLSLLIGWGLADHLYGIAAGHIYYFFEDIYPLMPTSNNFRLFKTPSTLRKLLNQVDEE